MTNLKIGSVFVDRDFFTVADVINLSKRAEVPAEELRLRFFARHDLDGEHTHELQVTHD